MTDHYDLVSQQQGGRQLFYHGDGLGSTRALTDAAGGVSDTYTYDAYGNLLGSAGSSENAYLFAGEQRDLETGLDYLRARYYDPSTGRFISPDAYEGTLSDPISQHDYQYAHGNPVVNTDPSGYVTLAEQLTAFSVHATLASMGFTFGYGIGTGLVGGDPLAIYDQYLAGFSHGASGGLSTQFRAQQYGHEATQNHRGPFFNLGQATGSVAVLGLGWGAPQSLANVGWAQRVAQIHSALSSLAGSYQSTTKILEGRSTAWDWLVYMPLITHFGSVLWNKLANNNLQILSDVDIYDNQGNLRILEVEELDSGAKQLKRGFLPTQGRTLAVGRVLNDDGSVTMAVSTSNNGQLTGDLRDLLNRSQWEAASRGGSGIPHAETRMIAWAEANGRTLEAIGVSHKGGICLSCYTDIVLRGITPASPFNPEFPADRLNDYWNKIENWIYTNR